MRRLICRTLCVITACFVSSCTLLSTTLPQTEESIADWAITKPAAFDLGMSPTLFMGQLKSSPTLSTCHTQGLEVVGDSVFISCCLYDPRHKISRSFRSESLLLKARLSEILDTSPNKRVTWHLSKLTEPVPDSEVNRITRALLSDLPQPIAWLLKWIYRNEPARHVIGHPSGIVYDEQQHGIWLGNAVYGKRSYAHVNLIDPITLKPSEHHDPIRIKQHLSMMALMPSRLLMSQDWGNRHFIFIDPDRRLIKETESQLFKNIQYQDCDRWDENTVLCAGNLKTFENLLPTRRGRLQLLDIEGNRIHSVRIRNRRTLQWVKEGASQATNDLGVRQFLYLEGFGDWEQGMKNRYGEHHSAMTLTNAGMALDPEGRYVYFLAEDLPFGKLVRMELLPRAKAL